MVMKQLDQTVLADGRSNRNRRRRSVAAVLAVLVLVALATVVLLARSTVAPPDADVAPAPSAVPPLPSPTEPSRPPRPNASTTGVPAGVTLTASGPLVVTVPGQVIDALDIDGCVDIKASDVVIKRSRITCSRSTTAIRQWTGSRGLLVEDVEIDGGGKVSAAVGFSSYTLRRVNIYNVVDGPRMASNTLIESSWIHGLARVKGSHNDAIQTTGGSNIVIRGNSLEVYDAASGDFLNAAIMTGSTTAAEVRDMLVEDNYFDGGNYAINFRKDLVADNVVFRNNRFGRNSRYGPVAGGGRKNGVSVDSSNVWDDTGQPLQDGSLKKRTKDQSATPSP